jgi:hypothetical protein
LAVGLALGAYVAVRHGLSVGWIGPGIVTPKTYQTMGAEIHAFTPHLGSWAVWALNVFLSFRWAWVLVIAFVWRLRNRQERAMLAVFTGCLGFGILASASVADVSRSIGYMTPAWLLATAWLAEENRPRLKTRLLWITIALILTPVFFTFEHFQVHWYRPLPLVLWRCFTGEDLVHYFR